MPSRNKTDPTGQAAQRRRATRQLVGRLTRAEKSVRALFASIPRTRRRETVLANANVIPVYDYQITPEELEILSQRIDAAVTDTVVETQFNRMPPNWWWQETIEAPYRLGTAEEVVEFNRLVTAELVRTRTARGLTTQRLEIGHVLRSADYLTALQRVYVRNFGELKSLSAETSRQVFGVIERGTAAGTRPAVIAQDIADRFAVSASRAARIANTEVNRAYNDARLDATEIAAKQTGLRAGVLHLSALIPTTRTTHAARHGNAYTVAQQRQWWDEGANRINCHCSTRSVLIDASGKVVDVELQEEIQAEREYFDAEG